MKNIVVMGAGLVGKAMILDLYKSYNITAVDISLENLSDFEKLPNISTIVMDLSVSSNIKKIVKNADLVIGAVPGFIGFNMLKKIFTVSIILMAAILISCADSGPNMQEGLWEITTKMEIPGMPAGMVAFIRNMTRCCLVNPCGC